MKTAASRSRPHEIFHFLPFNLFLEHLSLSGRYVPLARLAIDSDAPARLLLGIFLNFVSFEIFI